MAKSQTQETGRRTTNGPFAKYLEDENPNCPADRLTERYKQHYDVDRRASSLPRLRADHCCPECDSSDVFYTDRIGVARCDDCYLNIVVREVAPQEVLEVWD
jgi:ribosomal protein L37AE/L43A